MLGDYFERAVTEIENERIPVPGSPEAWEKLQASWREEFADMLGLNPMPARTDLKLVKRGAVEGPGFIVERLHFQSMPGLYVTANLYYPPGVTEKLPAILYVCGHADVKDAEGKSIGNKAGYQHHGEWFARHGYVCLIIDTVQLGEIRGEHHGTYNQGRWWWISRGYTPAGIEAWNGIRALDLMESLPNVDKSRIGITGRSGGGAYSWWIAALDERVRVVAPTAGITTLRNHIVDGCVEGHCDCMYMVNTRRWDYDKVAVLVAPRPLLILNTDKDGIFPLDGVMAVHRSVKRIYDALGAGARFGLQISEGPHKDTQALNVGAFAWFERWLKGADPLALMDEPAKKWLEPSVLRVFDELPADQRNTSIDETFVAKAGPFRVPADREAWSTQEAKWKAALKEKVFGAWPTEAEPLGIRSIGKTEMHGLEMEAVEFNPQSPWRLPMYVLATAGQDRKNLKRVCIKVVDEEGWKDFAAACRGEFSSLLPEREKQRHEGGTVELNSFGVKEDEAVVIFSPRGIGPTRWEGTKKQQDQRLRRFYLLGQTLDGMRTWDIRRAVAAVRGVGFENAKIRMAGAGEMGAEVVYAAIFEEAVSGIAVRAIPESHSKGPIYLNILRVMDMPQAVAMAAARTEVELLDVSRREWAYAIEAMKVLGRAGMLRIGSSGNR